MRLGNDIVDRVAAANEHSRFAKRILSAREYGEYENNRFDGPHDRIWHYWAAKEAAYKAYRQTKMSRFSPSAWIVDCESSLVHFEGETIPLRFVEDGDFILAEVSDGPWTAVHHAHSHTRLEPSPEDQSAAVRRLALGLGSQILSCYRDQLEIRKHNNIPQLWFRESERSYPLSLTHHGRATACSILVIDQPGLL